MSKETLIIITTVVAFLFPICLAIFWKTKTNCYWLAFATGALCFMIFAYVLEGLVNVYLINVNETTSYFLMSNPLAYGVFGALMAGLFEETGRLFGFKLLLKNHKEKDVSVGYGIGHGGIECVLVLGVNYLLYVFVILGGSLGDPASDAVVLQMINSIQTSIIPLAMFERIISIILHISLSIFVYKAANKTKSFYLYPFAILLHMISDVPAGLYQAGLITNAILVELLIAIITIVIFIFAIKMYKNMKDEEM